jgi:2-hydroxy-3-oxopropionate reductase
MSNIAFLGLGQMGAPMATGCFDAGHDLAVWNRTPDRAKPLVERGAGGRRLHCRPRRAWSS